MWIKGIVFPVPDNWLKITDIRLKITDIQYICGAVERKTEKHQVLGQVTELALIYLNEMGCGKHIFLDKQIQKTPY